MELIGTVLNIAGLIVLHEQVSDHAFDLFGRLQVIILFQIQPNHIDLVHADLAIHQFHCVFIFTVAVVIINVSSCVLRFQITQQIVDRVRFFVILLTLC